MTVQVQGSEYSGSIHSQKAGRVQRAVDIRSKVVSEGIQSSRAGQTNRKLAARLINAIS
ncbi:unnamed protein product [Staurois parvus]|uniref:Uncharacterized protein n=1 Tax=Staurois parvus TaxID=386267 RepID=A0ABN9DX90_9NEOB|nr:unnamed protein product [Staurois parvus]